MLLLFEGESTKEEAMKARQAFCGWQASVLYNWWRTKQKATPEAALVLLLISCGPFREESLRHIKKLDRLKAILHELRRVIPCIAFNLLTALAIYVILNYPSRFTSFTTELPFSKLGLSVE